MKNSCFFPLPLFPFPHQQQPAVAGKAAGPGPVCMIRVEGRGGQSREGMRHHVKGRSCRKSGPGERCFTLMGPMLSGRWSCRVSGCAGRRARNACRPATPGPQWLARPGSPLAHPSRMVRRAGEWCRVVSSGVSRALVKSPLLGGGWWGTGGCVRAWVDWRGRRRGMANSQKRETQNAKRRTQKRRTPSRCVCAGGCLSGGLAVNRKHSSWTGSGGTAERPHRRRAAAAMVGGGRWTCADWPSDRGSVRGQDLPGQAWLACWSLAGLLGRWLAADWLLPAASSLLARRWPVVESWP